MPHVGNEAVCMDNFGEAINRGIAGLEKKKEGHGKKEQEIIAYHESGHALVAESVPGADKVHRISIILRGIAALGYTLQLPCGVHAQHECRVVETAAARRAGRASDCPGRPASETRCRIPRSVMPRCLPAAPDDSRRPVCGPCA